MSEWSSRGHSRHQRIICSGNGNVKWKCTVKHLNRFPNDLWSRVYFLNLRSHSLGHINLNNQSTKSSLISFYNRVIYLCMQHDANKHSRLLRQFICLMRYLKMFLVCFHWHARFIRVSFYSSIFIKWCIEEINMFYWDNYGNKKVRRKQVLLRL